MPSSPAKLFYSYAHNDEHLRDQLSNHLAGLRKGGFIEEWHDRRISAGDVWNGTIDAKLHSADIILLLISSDFISSDYCQAEAKLAMERHAKSEARVVPVILREVVWEGFPYSRLQGLPKDAKPITAWPDIDKAFADVARGIRRILDRVYVPGYDCDVYISYSQKNNEPLPEDDCVARIVESLEAALDTKLGTGTYRLWFDGERLRGRMPISPMTRNAMLEKTATFVVIMSQGYLSSDRCLEELACFLKSADVRTDGTRRLFIVEAEVRGDASNCPSELVQRGYPFWYTNNGKLPSPSDAESDEAKKDFYYQLILDLSSDLTVSLTELKKSDFGTRRDSPDADTHRGVFLAEVTQDLVPSQWSVRRDLMDAETRVFPEIWYQGNGSALEAALDRDLGNCGLFTLLGTATESQASLATRQESRARAANLPILQWLDPKAEFDDDLESVVQREVIQTPLRDFVRHIAKRVEKTSPPLRPPVAEGVVLVNCLPVDDAFALAIEDMAKERGFAVRRADFKGTVSQIWRDIDAKLEQANGLIFIYGEARPEWVEGRMRHFANLVAKRQLPISAAALCEGPPPEKQPVFSPWSNMIVLDCRTGMDENGFTSFLNAL